MPPLPSSRAEPAGRDEPPGQPAAGARRLAATIPATPASLVRLRDEARDFLAGLGVDQAAAYAVDLVLEELVSNTLRHGGVDGARQEIEVSLEVGPELVTLQLRDDARPFDPTLHPAPARPASLAEAQIGGHGLPMVRRSVRALRYRRDGRHNCVEAEIARSVQPDGR